MPPVRIEDIPYRTIDGEVLLGRAYRPASPARALVVEVHGGAWTSGDRLNNVPIHEALAAHGIAVFALDFRMAPAHPYPAPVRDVNFGIRWAKARCEELAGARCPVGGLGTSSGGQLLGINALRPEDPLYTQPDASDAGETRVTFVIGGSDGLPAETKASARLTLAYGTQTWPHLLVRTMLAEQIYRAITILGGHPYHRE
jgi:acetyl esterase/lipase